MERDLRELTLDKMIESNYIEFYKRDTKDIILTCTYQELMLELEQEYSDLIQEFLQGIYGEDITEVSFVKEDLILYKVKGQQEFTKGLYYEELIEYFKKRYKLKGATHTVIEQTPICKNWEILIRLSDNDIEDTKQGLDKDNNIAVYSDNLFKAMLKVFRIELLRG